ncbi:helix-turn-helix domain-containing protein [Haladaptatus sp. T7]|uniref:helix-turn-helix domain-containing protein n=1 Tax=Haladaptatus sp. T7 TaxID=2029368 RepID=UPI0021A251ED|nr:helix-turn-helix domain-containing protein [Haladaptatus sp. T7]GKZ15999.1 hypothetical protein HAL_38800 [Haladaptatus sp. T7]
MESDTSNSTTDLTPDEIEQKLNHGSPHRRNILGVFDAAETDHLNTSTLRQRADVPTGSMSHHLKTLERWGLVEDTGQREYSGGGGRKARVWQLTSEGRTIIGDNPDVLSPPAGAATAERVTALENRIEELERETRQRRETIIDILQVLTATHDDATQQKVTEIVNNADLS